MAAKLNGMIFDKIELPFGCSDHTISYLKPHARCRHSFVEYARCEMERFSKVPRCRDRFRARKCLNGLALDAVVCRLNIRFPRRLKTARMRLGAYIGGS